MVQQVPPTQKNVPLATRTISLMIMRYVSVPSTIFAPTEQKTKVAQQIPPTKEKCTACNAGFTLNTGKCAADSGNFAFICPNGAFAGGIASAIDTEKCTACNTSYELTSDKCVLPDGVFLWVTKVRYNGNLMGEGGVTGAPTGADGQEGADAKCAHADNIPPYLNSLTHKALLFTLDGNNNEIGRSHSLSVQRLPSLPTSLVMSLLAKPVYQSVAGGTDAAITLTLGDQLVARFERLFYSISGSTSIRYQTFGELENRSKPYVKDMGTSLTLTYWSGANGNQGDNEASIPGVMMRQQSSNCNEWTSTNDTHTGNIGNAGWEQMTAGGVDLTEDYWLDLIDVWRETGGSGDEVHSNEKSNCMTGPQRLLCASYNTP